MDDIVNILITFTEKKMQQKGFFDFRSRFIEIGLSTKRFIEHGCMDAALHHTSRHAAHDPGSGPRTSHGDAEPRSLLAPVFKAGEVSAARPSCVERMEEREMNL